MPDPWLRNCCSAPEANSRWIVLHADDFGMNAAVNEGILRAFRDGLLTSTSLLANAPAAEEACAAWPQLVNELRAGDVASAWRRRQLGDDLRPFDLGVHLNLTQGRPLSGTYPVELLNDRGAFPGSARSFGDCEPRDPGFATVFARSCRRRSNGCSTAESSRLT